MLPCDDGPTGCGAECSPKILTSMTQPFIVQPGEGRLLNLRNFEAVVLADSPATSDPFTVLQTHGSPPARSASARSPRRTGSLLRPRGHLPDASRGTQEVCTPGTVVCVPANVVHTFVVVSDGPGKKLNLFSPGPWWGSSNSWRGEANGTATSERRNEISEANPMRIVRPVPDTYL